MDYFVMDSGWLLGFLMLVNFVRIEYSVPRFGNG